MLALSLIALAILLVNWVGYPLVMLALARARRRTAARTQGTPTVSVIIATRDDPETVLRRVADIRRAQFPPDRLQVIVAVDARAPSGCAAYARLLEDRALVVPGDIPGGKAAALNAGVRAATADILVFADSYQRFAPDAIAQLVRFLDDPSYGGVTGAVAHEGHRLMDLYWQYEMVIRRGQSSLHSIVSTAGGIQALRRALWEPLPAELICDDLYITMRVVRGGDRVGFCPSARAFDPRRFSDRQNFRRRVRTLTGLLQFIAWMPDVLVPSRNPIWIHFVCHKLMRFVTPYLVIVAGAGLVSLLLQQFGAALWLLAAATAALLVTIAALYPRDVKRISARAGWSLLLLAAPVVATFNGLRKRWQVWHYHEPLKTD